MWIATATQGFEKTNLTMLQQFISCKSVSYNVSVKFNECVFMDSLISLHKQAITLLFATKLATLNVVSKSTIWVNLSCVMFLSILYFLIGILRGNPIPRWMYSCMSQHPHLMDLYRSYKPPSLFTSVSKHLMGKWGRHAMMELMCRNGVQWWHHAFIGRNHKNNQMVKWNYLEWQLVEKKKTRVNLACTGLVELNLMNMH